MSATDDVFDDHFPGFPILPGALIVETFEQASQLLIGASHDYARVGRLTRVRRASFRHFVRPGDQLRVRCERTASADDAWTMSVAADVDGRRVASAVLEFVLVDAVDGDKAHAERLRETMRVLSEAPIAAPGL